MPAPAWDFEDLRRRGSAWLRDKSLDRVDKLFEGELLENAHAVVLAAHSALDHRHVAMHSVWTLTGQDAVTPVDDLVAALESSDPDAALAALVGRDIPSYGWCAVHPRTGGPGPASVAELRGIRSELEQANSSLIELRFRLASALYAGRPRGARRVFDPATGAPLTWPTGGRCAASTVTAGLSPASPPRPGTELPSLWISSGTVSRWSFGSRCTFL
jgi:hypothetical protein